MDSGFSSPHADAFPSGLRVLVVDDDLAWLRILEKMLKKCSYEDCSTDFNYPLLVDKSKPMLPIQEVVVSFMNYYTKSFGSTIWKYAIKVTTCCLAREALGLLRERKDGFDIVISDVNMPDMDGFKLLEHVGLEMDLPVIMMSVDGETSRVMRGVQHGACDYLLKPIRMKELKNIWQHVLRKRIHEVRDIENLEGIDEFQMVRLDQYDDGLFLSAGELVTGKKRKDNDNKHDEREYGDMSSVKKPRVVWTVDLHQKFVTAVNQIGLDKVGPKKILDLMNVPWLTRENVASHLQKYRLYLSRLQISTEMKASFAATNQSDLSTEDSIRSVGLQTPVNLQQTNGTRAICAISGNKAFVQKMEPKFHEGDMKNIVSLSTQEPKSNPFRDISDTQKASSSRIGPNHSFRPVELHVKHTPFDPSIPESYFYNEAPKNQFKKENGSNELPNIFQLDHVPFAPSVSSRPFNRERKGMAPIGMKILETGPIGGEADLFPVLVPKPMLNTAPSMKNQLSHNHGSGPGRLILDSCSGFDSTNGDLFSFLFQGDNAFKTNAEFQNKECLNPNIPELFAETVDYSQELQRLDYEYQWESIEYPVINQGLFII